MTTLADVDQLYDKFVAQTERVSEGYATVVSDLQGQFLAKYQEGTPFALYVATLMSSFEIIRDNLSFIRSANSLEDSVSQELCKGYVIGLANAVNKQKQVVSDLIELRAEAYSDETEVIDLDKSIVHAVTLYIALTYYSSKNFQMLGDEENAQSFRESAQQQLDMLDSFYSVERYSENPKANG